MPGAPVQEALGGPFWLLHVVWSALASVVSLAPPVQFHVCIHSFIPSFICSANTVLGTVHETACKGLCPHGASIWRDEEETKRVSVLVSQVPELGGEEAGILMGCQEGCGQGRPLREGASGTSYALFPAPSGALMCDVSSLESLKPPFQLWVGTSPRGWPQWLILLVASPARKSCRPHSPQPWVPCPACCGPGTRLPSTSSPWGCCHQSVLQTR